MIENIKGINIPSSIDEISLPEALDSEFGIKSVVINGEVQLLNGAVMPTSSEIKKAKTNLLEKYKQNAYSKYRAVEYPSVKDQLDALYKHFVETGVENEFTQMIKEVKDKYPKPE